MGSHPINLAFRFFLEISALISFGLWGWKVSDSAWRYVLVLIVPLIFAAIWGIFNVPEDPSRSGNAPIVIAGVLRFVLELSFFGLACLILYYLGYSKLWWIMGTAVILHYAISYDRILWLFSR
ncbi:MAG: YrdB family protein [Candidatus Marinimicrobia bacterium]|nr:YrdB family protein [Candidatus Neomarinimicrobiota bacterium]MBT4361063.1 YrdB family protein [Candidatus Neomarinimicrobiota bacterium]MBT4716325.1 YrdB family protein [Candidatus Neomarinimicrobiota bacterium]MBT4945375.1 YrdB family protein [Candidatus Neomarinimicrobiota bacterium]MBT5270823.1 YrdB family protein [Candidatus Neomarinimicrobiota bacterium]